MSGKTHSFFLSLTILAVMLFSAVGTTVVHADDGTGSSDAHAPKSLQLLHKTKPSLLEQVPDNTALKILDSKGRPQHLATQDAANSIATTTDPIWCPATQTTPTPGLNGCTVSYPSFDALLTALAGLSGQAGIIYVQQNAYGGGESIIDFNLYDLSNIESFDLTITGGWNTSNNTIDPTVGSTFNVPIVIGSSSNPWGGSLSINNISINNPNLTGLTLFSKNNINLDKVHVTGSVTGSGAELDAGGDVNINNSSFERNRQAGATIKAGGNVAIANSSFSNSGTNRLQMTGLDINSGGSVSLFDVLANGNREVGANIVANGRVSIGASFIGGSSFSGTKSTTTTTCPGTTSQFCGLGLQVVTTDAIDLNNVVASDNFLWGASLKADKDVNIANSIFNANTTQVPTFIDDTGLIVNSGGAVNLNNVQANDNRLFGATINAVGDVSINNSFFSNNTGITLSSGGVPTFHGIGLQVVSSGGGIFISGVTASNNFLAGAQLNAAGDVAISNSVFSNNSTGDSSAVLGEGLAIISGQNVFLETVTLDGNQLFGASIKAPGDVFLDFITATNNGTNGVEVDAKCTNLNSGAFTGNGQYGLSLVNSALNVSVSPVFSGNGLGDIFPTTPGACPVLGGGGGSGGGGGGTGGGGTGNTGNGNAGNGNTQITSLVSMNTGGFYGKAGLNKVVNFSLNSLFANNNPLFGANIQIAGNNTTVKIGIFTGKYAYVHSSHGMQIVSLFPYSLTDIAMGN